MALENLACSAEGATSNWTLVSGATKVAAVALPDDDGTSIINSGTTTNTIQQFALGDPSASIASNATINSVTYHTRVCGTDGRNNTNFRVTYVLGANTTAGSTYAAVDATYGNFSEALAKPGGGTWSKADLDSLEVRIQNTQARPMNCTTLYIVVDYTNPPAFKYTSLERGVRGLNRGIWTG